MEYSIWSGYSAGSHWRQRILETCSLWPHRWRKIPAAKAAVGRLAAARLEVLNSSLDELRDLRERIEKTIVPEPPLTFADGGVIAAGVDRDLDELRELSRNSKQVLAQIEQRERGRTRHRLAESKV